MLSRPDPSHLGSCTTLVLAVVNSMGMSCDPGCADWAKSFGDCICSTKDLSSFVLGLVSVFCMGICCLPQIIINFMNGSSEGLSLGMILIWSVGDVCNLTGVFLTKAVSCLTKQLQSRMVLHCIQQKTMFTLQTIVALPGCSCQHKCIWQYCLRYWTLC